MSTTPGHVVSILGATATGKTEVAIRLAELFAGEIVSMDSRQVYRGFDIGTAKPTREDRRRVRHHLVDILQPSETNSAGHHIRLAKQSVKDIQSRGKLPFLVGGTGLYFRAFFFGLIDVDIPDEELQTIRRSLEGKTASELHDELEVVDPIRAGELSTNDRVRISRALEVYLSTGKTHTQYLKEQARAASPGVAGDLRLVLTMPRSQLRDRIAERTKFMYGKGWVEEVAGLLGQGLTLGTPAMNSLGYASIAEAIVAGNDPFATLESVITLTQRYAKRQETFFRSLPDARWIHTTEGVALDSIRGLIEEWRTL